MAAGGDAGRLQQLPAAPRLCLPAERTHGHPRRLGPLLRRRARRAISRLRTGNAQIANIEYTNDGRANFALDPTNGAGAADLRAGAGHVLRLADPGCQLRGMAGAWLHRRDALSDARAAGVPRTVRVRPTSRGRGRPRSASSGSSAAPWPSRRTTSTRQGRDEKDVIDNVNLTFNPATGANYPAADRAAPRRSRAGATRR